MYDEIKVIKYNIEINIEYGIINGIKDVFLIKTDYDDNLYGLDNKYVKMARKVHDELGVIVIVCNTPSKVKEDNSLDFDIDFINDNFKYNNIYALGYLKGAYTLLSYSYKYNSIKRVMGINPPILYNLHLLKEGIRRFNNEYVYFINTKETLRNDELDTIKEIKNDKLLLIEISNMDSKFTNNTNVFIELPFKYMIDKKESK